jgi:membrane protein implicated in regulation of membrane protease activity
MKNPASRRGFQSQYSNTLAVLLSATLLAAALLLLARLLLSALLATLLLLAWLLLSTLLATTLLLLAGLLVRILILIHRSVSPTLVRSATQSRLVGKRQCTNRRIVPVRFPLDDQIVIGTPTPSDVFLLATGGFDDGTLSTAVGDRSANSNSRADLDVRRTALADAIG